jgi:hypothetical protein
MRRLWGSVLAVMLSATIAPVALAGQPDIYRDTRVYDGIENNLSDACGFAVTVHEASRFSVITFGDGGYDGHVEQRRTLTGPAATVEMRGAYSFGANEPSESFVDEETGVYTEVYRETYSGTVTMYVRGSGTTYTQAGWLYATVTITYPDDAAPIVTIEDVEFQGIHPHDTWGGTSEDLCSVLG